MYYFKQCLFLCTPKVQHLFYPYVLKSCHHFLFLNVDFITSND
jgi:hypothetical protein